MYKSRTFYSPTSLVLARYKRKMNRVNLLQYILPQP